MLNETALEKLAERLVSRIEEVNSYSLRLIGEQIKRIGNMTPTNANRLINVLKYGGDKDKIVQKLMEITQINIEDLYDIFEEMAINNSKFAKEFYDYKGVDYVPYAENVALQREVKAMAKATAETFLNMSETTAFKLDGKFTDLSETYQKVIDKSVVAINQGKATYQEAMRETIKELGSSGLRTVNYETGYSRRLDSSVRMNIMDAMKTMHNKTQEIIGEEVGADGVEISVHENPAPDHQFIQGKQYSLEEYEKLNNELVRPISTMNCYHYIFSIVMGVSEPRYTEEELQGFLDRNNKGFELDGRHYTNYEGTQLQRRLETEIRKTKDLHIISKASGNNELVAVYQKRITHLNRKYKELSDISGLPTKLDRLKVESFKRVNLKELN